MYKIHIYSRGSSYEITHHSLIKSGDWVNIHEYDIIIVPKIDYKSLQFFLHQSGYSVTQ